MEPYGMTGDEALPESGQVGAGRSGLPYEVTRLAYGRFLVQEYRRRLYYGNPEISIDSIGHNLIVYDARNVEEPSNMKTWRG